jgi:hypothetical protein
MSRTKRALDKHHTRLMPRTPEVTQLKHLIIQNPGLTIGQLVKRLDTTYNTIQSLLVRAEAQGLLLAQAPQRPAGIYFFRDLAEIDATHSE